MRARNLEKGRPRHEKGDQPPSGVGIETDGASC